MSSVYHIDPEKILLKSFFTSLDSRELIPSRTPLKEKLWARFKTIQSTGLVTLGDLLVALKTKPEIEAFSKRTGLDKTYLTLLKREASSYFPNPVQLNKFSGLNPQLISALEERGIKNSKQLFDRAAKMDDLISLMSESNVSEAELKELIHLCDLSRLYGVGPVFARMLYDIGIDSVKRFQSCSAGDIIKIYEEATKKKADFTEKDILFTLEMAKELDLILENISR